MCVTDSTRSHARKTSTTTLANQRIPPSGGIVTDDSGVTTMRSESNEKAAENGNASHDSHVTTTSSQINEEPIVSENTNDQKVVTMPTESNKGNSDVTMVNEDIKTDIP